MSSSDDEDLKLAKALSMHQKYSTATTKAVVDLTSDNEGEDEDEDLKRAIAMSLQDDVYSTESTEPLVVDEEFETVTSSQAVLTPQAAEPSSVLQTLAGNSFVMDRKSMESERLKRLAERKRKRSSSLDQPSRQLQEAQAPAKLHCPSGSHQRSNESLQYPRGTIKRTFAAKLPRTDDLTIDELLQASIVSIAVISSFQWDAEWLGRKLSHNKIKQHWVMNARDAETQARWRRDLAECGIPNLRIHFPPMNTVVGNAHSKYMLLVSENKMRVVISTANMEREYWGEVGNDWQTGVLENSIFVIDLPRRADAAVGSMEDLTPFGKELVHFLQAQQLDPLIIKGVLKFDFSQTANLAFVHSIACSSDVSTHPTGLPGLAKAIQDLKLDQVRVIELDYAASSLGAIDETLLQRIYLAAQGLSFELDSKAAAHWRDHFRIYYPTAETIGASTGGPNCAGIVSLKRTHFSSASFPIECLRDYVSTRKGMISHNKLLFARGRHEDGRPFAWVYVGSANISESAWGAQKVLKSGKLGKLTMRNWESGVIVPVPEEKFKVLALEDDEVPPMSIFEGTIEVPMQYPGEAYRGRMPWVQDW
ncbi:tyrosyl-DNA phosphodiesterase domain-containing protein [Boeremia exigua]|uniref:tyrosyl-DNA phosphodiesterase domain-containing protein n=1 Tax=Boeremia exigua TaxID=749465 RepID=UPI001E8E4993|nr:tyrosyl-DNA phosphodiesterase domain-containing protein [Boeremia exigua]KAH6625205.1 tyrosyl-DNA phosphodiesterase domain-containing protein [Boeremia exigua]